MQWLSTALHYPFYFILLISILVFVHEFGHFIIARWCGIRVETFSIGFGPELFGWNDRYNTRWRFALVPMGGYVKMFGDADPSSAPDADKAAQMTEDEKRWSFFHKPVSKRMAVVVAGPAMNYIFAWLVLSVLFVTVGQPFTVPKVYGIVENSPAARAGVLNDDTITAIDSTPVERFEELQQYVRLRPDQAVTLHVKRADAALNLPTTLANSTLTDRFGGVHKIGLLGIKAKGMAFVKHGPLTALRQAMREIYNMTASTLKAVGQIITGERGTEDLGGPLRIAQMSGEMASEGIAPWFMLLAIISVNLGLVNLFPIPVLDGGHLVFYTIEAVIGRPIPTKAITVCYKVGLALVMTMMVFALWNDITQLHVVNWVKGKFIQS